MNTVMAQAMQAAGVPGKPISERIWLWLRDHPHATAFTLATELIKLRRALNEGFQ